MSRLVRSAYTELTLTTYRDGDLADADAPPAVTIRRDGAVIEAGAALDAPGIGAYTYPLAAATVSTLGELTVEWAYVVAGAPTTHIDVHEVVGGPVITLAELRRYEPLDDPVKYPDEFVLAARDALIEALEHECRTAFVRRVRTEDFDDSAPMRKLALSYGTASRRHRGPTITAATVNGITVDLALTPLRVGAGGLVHRRHAGFGHAATVTYEYGYDAPPGRVKRAVALGVADWLAQELDSPIPDRATSWSTDAGTFAVVTAGARGAVFSLPELNAIVQGYAE